MEKLCKQVWVKMWTPSLINFWNDEELTRYISNAIVPFVKGLYTASSEWLWNPDLLGHGWKGVWKSIKKEGSWKVSVFHSEEFTVLSCSILSHLSHFSLCKLQSLISNSEKERQMIRDFVDLRDIPEESTEELRHGGGWNGLVLTADISHLSRGKKEGVHLVRNIIFIQGLWY